AGQPPRASAVAISLGEQPCAGPLTCRCTEMWRCAPGSGCTPGGTPGGSCVTAATARADSVPSGPAWPIAKIVAPCRSWPRLARGTTTSVSAEVVTRTRAPLEVTRVKPAELASDTVPRTEAKPRELTALNLLGEHALTGHQQNLHEYDPAVL